MGTLQFYITLTGMSLLHILVYFKGLSSFLRAGGFGFSFFQMKLFGEFK